MGGLKRGKREREGSADLAHGQAGLPKATPNGTGRKAKKAEAGGKAKNKERESVFTPERSAGQRGAVRRACRRVVTHYAGSQPIVMGLILARL